MQAKRRVGVGHRPEAVRRWPCPATRCKPTAPPAELSKPTARALSPFSVSESKIRPERRRQSRCSCSPPPPAASNAIPHDHRHRRKTPRTLALSCESPVDFSTGLPVNQPRAGTRGSKKWLPNTHHGRAFPQARKPQEAPPPAGAITSGWRPIFVFGHRGSGHLLRLLSRA